MSLNVSVFSPEGKEMTGERLRECESLDIKVQSRDWGLCLCAKGKGHLNEIKFLSTF